VCDEVNIGFMYCNNCSDGGRRAPITSNKFHSFLAFSLLFVLMLTRYNRPADARARPLWCTFSPPFWCHWAAGCGLCLAETRELGRLRTWNRVHVASSRVGGCYGCPPYPQRGRHFPSSLYSRPPMPCPLLPRAIPPPITPPNPASHPLLTAVRRRRAQWVVRETVRREQSFCDPDAAATYGDNGPFFRKTDRSGVTAPPHLPKRWTSAQDQKVGARR
jgi:hypothetical protein